MEVGSSWPPPSQKEKEWTCLTTLQDSESPRRPDRGHPRVRRPQGLPGHAPLLQWAAAVLGFPCESESPRKCAETTRGAQHSCSARICTRLSCRRCSNGRSQAQRVTRTLQRRTLRSVSQRRQPRCPAHPRGGSGEPSLSAAGASSSGPGVSQRVLSPRRPGPAPL